MMQFRTFLVFLVLPVRLALSHSERAETLSDSPEDLFQPRDEFYMLNEATSAYQFALANEVKLTRLSEPIM